MKASLKLATSAFALALASSAASAQAVISRSVAPEPVETTVMQTPAGTVVTRRPLAEEPAPFVAPHAAGPVFAQPTAPAATFVDTAPETVDTFTTRQVVQRAAVESESRPMVTRQVSARRHPVVQRKLVRHIAPPVRQRPVVAATVHQRPVVAATVRQRPIVQRAAPVIRTRQVALTHPAPRLVLNPREQQIVYRTIVEREVIPRRPVIVAPAALPAPAYVAPQVMPPVVAADEAVVTAPIAVGTVLPPNVPLYAIPQNVALTVPATQPYSYAWLGGRAYLVDPASGVVVADLAQ